MHVFKEFWLQQMAFKTVVFLRA